jgi:hypothetical protein
MPDYISGHEEKRTSSMAKRKTHVLHGKNKTARREQLIVSIYDLKDENNQQGESEEFDVPSFQIILTP